MCHLFSVSMTETMVLFAKVGLQTPSSSIQNTTNEYSDTHQDHNWNQQPTKTDKELGPTPSQIKRPNLDQKQDQHKTKTFTKTNQDQHKTKTFTKTIVRPTHDHDFDHNQGKTTDI